MILQIDHNGYKNNIVQFNFYDADAADLELYASYIDEYFQSLTEQNNETEKEI